MNKVIRYYNPSQTVVLYDRNLHKICRGTLILNHFTSLPQIKNPLYKKLAIGVFYLSIIGFLTLLIPILTAYIGTKVAKAQMQNNRVSLQPEVKGDSQYRDRNGQIINYKSDEFIPAEDFKILISKIGVESMVIPNVDATREEEYRYKLKDGIAHAKGSYFPGEGGPVYLFSHSTDSIFNISFVNAKFYALKDLELGDEINLEFKNKNYNYLVKEKKIIDPRDLDQVRKSDSDLILQTCWPPGTDWQRLIVYADQKI